MSDRSMIHVEVLAPGSHKYAWFRSIKPAYTAYGMGEGTEDFWSHKRVRRVLRAKGVAEYTARDGRQFHFRRV